ncbi:MAG: hypothetical protein N3B01_06020 [Verrucomicrobiae bacterium]|nr:hypothetical protein [Verrucomicrobiae bacterium]
MKTQMPSGPNITRIELHSALAPVWAFITILLSFLLREEHQGAIYYLAWAVAFCMFCAHMVLCLCAWLHTRSQTAHS